MLRPGIVGMRGYMVITDMHENEYTRLLPQIDIIFAVFGIKRVLF